MGRGRRRGMSGRKWQRPKELLAGNRAASDPLIQRLRPIHQLHFRQIKKISRRDNTNCEEMIPINQSLGSSLSLRLSLSVSVSLCLSLSVCMSVCL